MAGMDAGNDPSPSADLVGLMGRQLREPLHALVGLIELLNSSGLPADTREIVALLRTQVADLRTLVDDLVDSTQLQSGALALRLRPAALGALVADVVAAASARVDASVVTIVADIGPGVPNAVLVDPWRLRQMLDRLVAHVVANTPSGRIVLGVDQVGLEGDISTVQFTVTGPGPIGAVDGGVVLAEQLARAMGGAVAPFTERSGYHITLPLPTTDLPPIDPELEPVLIAPEVTVLVVDDEPVNRVLAEEQLDRLGLRAVSVANGEDAVALVADQAPDIVLMDVVMPGIDGLEATRRIRELEVDKDRRTVVIGITASALASDRLAAEEAGMDDILAKPVNMAMLSEAISKWVRGGVHMMSDRSAIDETTIDELCHDLGGAALVATVVRMYLNELHGRRRALAEAVDAGDLAAAKVVAHTLKSGSAMLGAHQVADACERLGRLQQTEGLHQVAADIMRTSTAASRWLHGWLARQPYNDTSPG